MSLAITRAAATPGATRPTTQYTYGTNGRVATVTTMGSEANTFHTLQYFYAKFGPLSKITYDDGTTEQWFYGTTGNTAARVYRYKNRLGHTTEYTIDPFNRITRIVENALHIDNNGTETPTGDLTQQRITDRTYWPATRLVVTEISDGRRSEYAYDYRHRRSQTTRYSDAATAHVSKTVYYGGRVFYTEDEAGFRQYAVYSASNATQMIRRITWHVPYPEMSGGGNPFADNNNPTPNELLQLNRTDTAAVNGLFSITDAIKDPNGNVIELIDPLGVSTQYETDSRGRQTATIQAVGTAVQTRSETDYDAANAVIEVRSARYFDASDPEASHMRTTTTWNGRGLQASQTVAIGSSVQGTSTTTWTLNDKVSTTTDAAGHTWSNHYNDGCCEQYTGRRDPLGHGSLANQDALGRTTHTATVENFDSHTIVHNPVDNLTLNESTVRYDGLGRSYARTIWLAPRGYVDRNDPPIAGLDNVPAADGLTSQTLYDANLADGVGLDSAGGLAVHVGGYSVNLLDALAKLAAPNAQGGLGLNFTADHSAPSGSVSIDPAGGLSFSIADGAGRTVISGQLYPAGHADQFDVATWSCTRHDGTTSVPAPGTVRETATIDPLGNMVLSRTDGGGRTIQSVDAEGNVTAYQYDAASRVLQVRDPNNVGYDAVYDPLGRVTSRTDTHGDTTTSSYDAEGNVVATTDAKGQTTTTTYDPLNRRSAVTDRLGGVTTYVYSVDGMLDQIMDAEGQITAYTYNARHEKTVETYPDHTPGSVPGDAGYGQIQFAYDPAGRLQLKTDQLGDTVTFTYDMANRLLNRDYRLKANSPSGPIADSDSFSYDAASRMLTATSGRYSNTVTNAYDELGRLANESLTIAGQTYTTTRAYDSRGQLAQMTYPDGTQVNRTYTPRGQLNTVSYAGNVVDTRTYDPGGRLSTSTYGNGVVTTWTYRDDGSTKRDNMLDTIATSHPAGVTDTVGDYSYTWDANKNKTSESITGVMSPYGFNSATGQQPAAYDADDRLVGWNRNDGNQDQAWTLTPVGDWDLFTEEAVTQDRSHGPAHEITDVTIDTNSYSVQHDVKGNVTFIPAILRGDSATTDMTLTWDFDNRLSSADTDNGGTADVTFGYDALGRRVRKTTATLDTVFVQAGQQVIADYTAGAAATSPREKFVYASYIDEPILKDGTLASGTGIVYYHCNQQYSVTALTDASGSVIERYAYDPHGALTILDGSGTPLATQQSPVSNRTTYTGRELDIETHLYHFRARLYSPTLGRFLTRDPLGFVDGLSLYRGYFVPGKVDPSGKDIVPPGSLVPDPFGGGNLDPFPWWDADDPTTWTLDDPSRARCRIGLDCVNLGSGVGAHCGIVMKNSDGTTTRLHSWGWFHPGGKSCKISTGRPSSADDSSYYQHWLGTYDQSICDCVSRKVATFNKFIGSYEYRVVPSNDACGTINSTCNSNYSAHCLLRGCGLNITWSWAPVGWNHRLKKCTKTINADPAGVTLLHCKCLCQEWKLLDGHICDP